MKLVSVILLLVVSVSAIAQTNERQVGNSPPSIPPAICGMQSVDIKADSVPRVEYVELICATPVRPADFPQRTVSYVVEKPLDWQRYFSFNRDGSSGRTFYREDFEHSADWRGLIY